MPLLTNELLEKLTNSIGLLSRAISETDALGLPVVPDMPFYRMGEAFRIPVSPTSGVDWFDITVPPNVTAFQWTNNNPFSVRLKGARAGVSPRVPITATTGWLWLPATQGIRTSLMPVAVSAMSVDGPYAATSPEQAAGVGFVELQYGTGQA